MVRELIHSRQARKSLREERKDLREERRVLKELRKLKKLDIIEEYESSNSKSIVNNSAVVNITLLSLGFSAIVSLTDIQKGIAFGAGALALTTGAIFLEAFIESTAEVLSDFIHMNFGSDRERRRSYNQTKKVIDYAIKSDRLSDEQISMMIESLVSNAKHEQQQKRRIDMYDNIYSINNTKEAEQEPIDYEKEINEALAKINGNTNTDSSDSNTNESSINNNAYSLIFNDADISIMKGDVEEYKVTYDEIQQATTEEEIASMPYSTIYGYVVKEDKTIYIDMEQEIAIVK